MQKQEILDILTEKEKQILLIKQNLNILSSQDEEILDYLEKLEIFENYLSLIKSELDGDVIPEYFYSKISSTITSINIDNIYKFFENQTSADGISQLKYLIPQNRIDSIGAAITYKFYKDLNFFTENIVVVGANGSGKSTLANQLKAIITERDGVVISAQKLLIVPTFDNVPNFSSSTTEYNQYQSSSNESKITYNASKTNDIPYTETQKFGSEYKFVLKTLIAEKGNNRNIYCDNVEKNVNIDKSILYSKLDVAIEIWNSLIDHRTMYYTTHNELMIRDNIENQEYQAYKMSDGEKVILFLIGRVLLANPNSMIIIDEPEMYLHKSIVNKLWDKLENLKNDCIFVYLTHDLDFASSRIAEKYWIQDFKYPIKWEIEHIPENDIPEHLLMKLLGSRKKILFCEGKKDSLDIQIFEILYPNYTITPVSSCNDVINYVRSFNKIPNKNAEAIGFIDRDFRVKEQIDKLNTENVFSYSVAEIENLFLVKDFISKYAEYKNENVDLEKLEEKVLLLLENNKIVQASNFTSANINYKFSESHVKKGNDFEQVEKNLENFIAELNIENTFNERIKDLEKIISDKDYSKAILFYNNKGLLSIVEELFSLKSNSYRYKALDFLKSNKEAQSILRSKLPAI